MLLKIQNRFRKNVFKSKLFSAGQIQFGREFGINRPPLMACVNVLLADGSQDLGYCGPVGFEGEDFFLGAEGFSSWGIFGKREAAFRT